MSAVSVGDFSFEDVNAIENLYDFKLIVNNVAHDVCSFLCCQRSILIFNFIYCDCITNKMEIKGFDFDYTNVIRYLNFGLFEFEKKDFVNLLKCSVLFESQCLLNESMKFFKDVEKDPKVLCGILFDLYSKNLECSELFNYIASKFGYLIETNHFNYDDQSFIELILKSNKLQVYPNVLKNFLINRFNILNNTNTRLINYFPFYTTSIKEFDITKVNVNRLRSLLIKISSDENIPSTNVFDYRPLPNRELEGIIHDFYKPIIKAKDVFKESNRAELLLLSEIELSSTDQYFCSRTGPENWLIFDFEPYRVIPTHYVIQSWPGATNKVAPKSYEFYGSIDGKEWDMLHSVSSSYELAKDSKILIHKVNNESLNRSKKYRYFKFLQLESCNNLHQVLALSGFEIYGKIFN